MRSTLGDTGLLARKTDYQSDVIPQRSYHLFFVVLSVLADVSTIFSILAGGFFLVAYADAKSASVNATWVAQAPLVAILFIALGSGMVIIFLIRGHYTQFVSPICTMRQLSEISCFYFVVSLSVLVWAPAPSLWRFLPGVWLVIPVLISVNRLLLSRVLRHLGLNTARVLIIGSPSALEHLRSAISSDRFGSYNVVAQLDLTTIQMPEHLSIRSYLQQEIRIAKANFLVVSLRECRAHLREAILNVIEYETIPYIIVPDFGKLPVSNCKASYYMSNGCMMLSFRSNMQNPLARFFKELLDRIVALTLLVLCLPIFVLVTFAVAADGGPVLYSQIRIGQHGRRFRCLKFRSMAVNADKLIINLLATDQEAADEWARTRKLRQDPRVTHVGHFLRRTSLDELPQLLNVLKGEMSLVGPRPVVVAEIARYGSEQDLYMRVKPGITGLWQVSGRSETTYEQRVALDAWYAKNWSFWHDLTILFRTIPALISRRGAV